MKNNNPMSITETLELLEAINGNLMSPDQAANVFKSTLNDLGALDTKNITDKFSDDVISFDDIINFKPTNDAEKINFWYLVKLLTLSKYNRNDEDSKIPWRGRLVNAFYKPSLTEHGILKTLQEKLPSFKVEMDGFIKKGFNEHDCIFIGPGADVPDFKSALGSFECKSSTTKSYPHDADVVLTYTTSYSSGTGKFKISSFKKEWKDKVDNSNITEEEKAFIQLLIEESAEYTIEAPALVIPPETELGF